MTRLLGIVAGIVLAGAAVWTVAAQTSAQPAASIVQEIPVVASVPVTLDDGSVQTVTVPLTVTLNVDVSVDGATAVGAEVAQAEPVEPVADEVTLENAGDFLPTLDDMPEGYTLRREAEAMPNDQLAEEWPDPAAALEAFNELGRLGGYNRSFQVSGFPLVGNATVDFTIIVFDEAQGAADAIPVYRERHQAKVDSGEAEAILPISVSSLGDNVDAYTLRFPASSEDTNDGHDEHNIAFAKGNALVFVQGNSFTGVGDPKQLIDFAKWVEQRLP
jgi:hypothetical protein